MGLFAITLAAPIVYSVYLSLRKVQVEGLGLVPGARREVVGGTGQLPQRAHRPGAFSRVLCGCSCTAPCSSPPCSAWRCSSRCCWTPAARAPRPSRGRRSSCRTPSPPSSPASCGASSTCRGSARSPGPSRRVGLPTPELLSADLVLFSVANIALWGGVGFNMIVLFTALRAIPTELYEAARLDGAGEIAHRLADQDPDHPALAGDDDRLLADRDAPGLRGADDAAARSPTPSPRPGPRS